MNNEYNVNYMSEFFSRTSPRDFGERILVMKFRMRGGWKKKHGKGRKA